MKWMEILWQWVERWAHGALWEVMQQLEEMRWRLFQSLLMILLATACGWMALLLLAVLVLLVCWDSHRLEAISVLLLVYAATAVWMVRRAGRMALLVRAPSPRHCACASCRDRASRVGGDHRGGL